MHTDNESTEFDYAYVVAILTLVVGGIMARLQEFKQNFFSATSKNLASSSETVKVKAVGFPFPSGVCMRSIVVVRKRSFVCNNTQAAIVSLPSAMHPQL